MYDISQHKIQMSHRKVFSQGSIPFSWEDSPGVCKVIHKDCPMVIGTHPINQSSSPSPTSFPHDSDTSVHDMKIPLPPPCPKVEPPRRSSSTKGFRFWHEDPFLAAYKECTKIERSGKLSGESKKNVGSKVVKSRFIFSCKNSCNVKDDNLVRLSNLPPIPRDRVKGR